MTTTAPPTSCWLFSKSSSSPPSSSPQCISINFLDTLRPFVSGAIAGLAVDCTLFPLDTIKTRLQSPQGFWLSGGFRRLYLGLGSTVSGSAPGGALFFLTYETCKKLSLSNVSYIQSETIHSMMAAIVGETVACTVRVPVELIKQRAQVYHGSSMAILRETLASGAGIRTLYRGYFSTISREIPFSIIQFPIWEWLKRQTNVDSSSPPTLYNSMFCGSIAGGIAAFITTPLDVAKTQIMLANFRNAQSSTSSSSSLSSSSNSVNNSSSNPYRMMYTIFQRNGIRGLFSGALPRVAWISLGGSIFLGGYDQVSNLLGTFSSTSPPS